MRLMSERPGTRRCGRNIVNCTPTLPKSLDLSFDEASLLVTQGCNWTFTHWAQYRSMKSAEDEKELKNIVMGWYGENPMRALIDNPRFRGFFDAEFTDWVVGILPPTAQPAKASPKR